MFAFLQSRPQLDEFQTVLAQRSGRWYNACLRITRDAQLAEDAVQDALLRAWGRRTEFRGEAELDTWIHRIALNAAIDLMRKRRAPTDDGADLDTHAAPAADAPDRRYATQAFGNDLAGAMARLTALERDCFVLKHIEGWTLDEIAASQESNVNNTKQALFRAVRKLREGMDAWRGEA